MEHFSFLLAQCGRCAQCGQWQWWSAVAKPHLLCSSIRLLAGFKPQSWTLGTLWEEGAVWVATKCSDLTRISSNITSTKWWGLPGFKFWSVLGLLNLENLLTTLNIVLYRFWQKLPIIDRLTYFGGTHSTLTKKLDNLPISVSYRKAEGMKPEMKAWQKLEKLEKLDCTP